MNKIASQRQHQVLLVAGLLLLIAAARIIHLAGLELIDDEVWAIWRTFGDPVQIVRWVPYDWPPLFYLILGVWKALVGINPIMVRFLSVLASLLGAAFTYRVMLRLFNERAALLSMLVFGALSYSIFLSVYLRGYIWVVSALPLALWLTARYFDRPTWKRGLLLGVLMAAMFYTYFTTAIAFGALGLYTLIVYRRQVWRWWLPGVVSLLLAIPLILDRASVVVRRVDAVQGRVLPGVIPALAEFYTHYGGDLSWLWLILYGAATLFILYRVRPLPARYAVLLLWMVGGPLLMYALDDVLFFFSPRYSWWVMLGCVFWLGLALSHLPRRLEAVAAGMMVAIMFMPVPFRFYALQTYRPFVANFEWLAQRILPGDAVLLDTHCGGGLSPEPDPDGGGLILNRAFTCGTPEQWRYMQDVYFPDGGLNFITQPGSQRRIWYVKQDGWHNRDLEAAIRAGRVEREFVGPWDFLVRLYEAPPDPTGIPFDNGMRFHGLDFIEGDGRIWTGPMVTHGGEPVSLRLWWSVDRPVDLDYSLSVQFLSGERALLPPADDWQSVNPRQTSRWQPGQFYVEERTLDIPFVSSAQSYGVYLAVYYWEDGRRIPAPGVNADGLLPLRVLYIKDR